MKIVFAHSVYNRFKTLRDTISIEKRFFPEANISIAYNGDFINIFNEINNIQFINYGQKEHKIGALNGCILSVQQLLHIDFDVLIFSHDDVFINENYVNVVNKHIESIIDGKYDIICRKPQNYQNSVDVFGGYYSFEVFYISKNAAIKLFLDLKTLKTENEIPKCLGSISPEVWFYELVSGNILKINEIRFGVTVPYDNTLISQQMGYYHKNADIRYWRD